MDKPLSADTKQLHSSAWGAYKQGQLKAAWQSCQTLTQRYPNYAAGWDISSRVLLAAGQAGKALECIERALGIEEVNPVFNAQKVYCLLALHRNADADELTERLAARCADNAALLDTLGNLYSLNKKQELALAAFEKAVTLEPDNAHYCFNLALARQSLGDLDGAEAAFDKSIRLRPDDYEAWLHRSRLRRQSAEKNHTTELENLIAESVEPWRGEVTLRYALAKEYEDIGEHAKSFDHLSAGASLRRSHMQYSIDNDLGAIESIIHHFSADFMQHPRGGFTSSEPIFIVGLPRTGTTLVERIIGSHSAVHAAGELNNFAEQLRAQVAAQSPQKPEDRGQFIAASTRIDFTRLGKDYIDSTRPQTGQTPRFVDKLPLNFLYCGLIAHALPQAKIIHLTRHPMDACYAIFKTLFKQAYPFSYDLQELGQYYLGYRTLMAHWHNTIPGRILDVSYEALVKDQELVSRRILDYCELDWEATCLDFHKSDAPSMTASLVQVRNPVYDSSIGLWRNFQQQLQPLQTLFAKAGFDIE